MLVQIKHAPQPRQQVLGDARSILSHGAGQGELCRLPLLTACTAGAFFCCQCADSIARGKRGCSAAQLMVNTVPAPRQALAPATDQPRSPCEGSITLRNPLKLSFTERPCQIVHACSKGSNIPDRHGARSCKRRPRVVASKQESGGVLGLQGTGATVRRRSHAVQSCLESV